MNGWRTWIPGRAKWTQTHLSSVDGMQSYLLKTQPLQIMRVSSEHRLSFFETALSTIHILASLFSQNPNHSVSGLPLLEISLPLSRENPHPSPKISHLMTSPHNHPTENLSHHPNNSYLIDPTPSPNFCIIQTKHTQLPPFLPNLPPQSPGAHHPLQVTYSTALPAEKHSPITLWSLSKPK